MANNVMETQVKKISLALGALVDGAYLWAGADKGIASELQGKDQGDTVYYRVTSLGEMGDITGISDGAGRNTGSGQVYSPTNNTQGVFPSTYPSGDGYATLAQIRQVVVPVSVKDINVMYEVKAFERQCTSIGEALARAKVGQKMIKKVIKNQIRKDIKTISNIFLGDVSDQSPSASANQFKCFQLCGAHMKSFLDTDLYGFMDWNVWGQVTATGQQAVPCALAKPEFGKELVGSWTLINQLRIIPDLPYVDLILTTGSDTTIDTSATPIVAFAEATSQTTSYNEDIGATMMEIKITPASGKSIPTSGYVLVDLYEATSVSGTVTVGDQLENVDGNDIPNGRYAQLLVNLGENTAATRTSALSYYVEAPSWIKTKKLIKNYANTATSGTDAVNHLVAKVYQIGSTAVGKYGMTIVRGENAQVWGTIDTINCEGAHYSKSSVEGVTIHENKQAEVRALKTYDRFDMVYAAKLVEPRLASIVLCKL